MHIAGNSTFNKYYLSCAGIKKMPKQPLINVACTIQILIITIIIIILKYYSVHFALCRPKECNH